MENKVYIARTDALSDEKLFARLYNAVSEERRRKADRFVQKRDKMLSIAAEILLRRALFDCGIEDFSLRYGENGKPYLSDNAVYFNLSHSENTVICAVSEREIGVDAEKVSEADLEVARRFFHRDEFALLENLPTSEEKRDMFFRLWTLKESFVKALGKGVLMPLDSFCIDLTKGEISVRQNVSPNKYFFKEYALGDGFKYAACGLCGEFEDKVRFVELQKL
ncbi:MAG: 4'-phosphopantetheinyl transferase family protein [Oscillospiraceae bacterium]